MTRRALLLAGCALAVLSFPASAGAHAVLVATTPRWGAELKATPQMLRLSYNEGVVPQYARVAVVAANGENLAGVPRVSGSFVVVPLRPGPRGSDTVRWQMVASDDGHVTEGAFTFGVGVKPLPPVPAPGVGVPVAPELLAWLQFLGIVLAGGALLFRAAVLVPAARVLGEEGAPDARAALWVGVAGAVIALHAGLLAFLVGAYPIVGGGLVSFLATQIVPIRVGTHLGQAWMVMTFAWLAVLALLVGAWVTPQRRERLLASAGLLSLAIAFGISWASHPDSRGTLALVADYLHLAAAALWVGGLVALALLAGVMRPRARADRDALVRACVLRFSRLAAPAVAVLALAGGYLVLREFPGPAALFDTRYGITLVIKTVAFAGALALAGYHQRSVAPRLAAGAPVASMRRTLALEVALLVLALALAAVLSQTAPPG
jgi:copper transport protein